MSLKMVSLKQTIQQRPSSEPYFPAVTVQHTLLVGLLTVPSISQRTFLPLAHLIITFHLLLLILKGSNVTFSKKLSLTWIRSPIMQSHCTLYFFFIAFDKSITIYLLEKECLMSFTLSSMRLRPTFICLPQCLVYSRCLINKKPKFYGKLNYFLFTSHKQDRKLLRA